MALSNIDKSFVKSQNVNRPLTQVATVKAAGKLSSFSGVIVEVAKRQNDLMLRREHVSHVSHVSGSSLNKTKGISQEITV